jgi:hypothetical protein
MNRRQPIAGKALFVYTMNKEEKLNQESAAVKQNALTQLVSVYDTEGGSISDVSYSDVSICILP